jgi:type II secretory pathway component PulC
MSIIQEALRKAQGRQGESKVPVSPTESSPPAMAPQKDGEAVNPTASILAVRNVKISLAIIVAVLAIIVIRQMLSTGDDHGGSRKTAPSRQEVVYKPASPKEDAKPADSVMEKAASSFPKPESFGLKPVAPDLVLNGIMYLPDKPQAIINDSVVTEGDTVSGATVRKIERNRVVLDYDKLEITLNLKAT